LNRTLLSITQYITYLLFTLIQNHQVLHITYYFGFQGTQDAGSDGFLAKISRVVPSQKDDDDGDDDDTSSLLTIDSGNSGNSTRFACSGAPYRATFGMYKILGAPDEAELCNEIGECPAGLQGDLCEEIKNCTKTTENTIETLNGTHGAYYCPHGTVTGKANDCKCILIYYCPHGTVTGKADACKCSLIYPLHKYLLIIECIIESNIRNEREDSK
jgi:hypothetical protein